MSCCRNSQGICVSFRAFALFLLLGALALAPTAKAQQPVKAAAGRDWKKYPAIFELDTTQDIYALGDIHGDYERLVSLLQTTGVIAEDPPQPEKIRWKAGKAVLVCTGDIIDKGNQSCHVIVAMRALQASAREAGGQVVVLMGNHEAEFISSGGSTKKAAEFIKELRVRDIKPEDVALGRDALGIGEFLRSLPMAARVNDWFFAHAGSTRGRTLKELQADLESGVDKSGYKTGVLLDKDGLLEARLHPNPWWEREGETPAAGQERLAGYAAKLGVKHLVLGHQPGKVVFSDQSTRMGGELFQKYDGLVFLIDVGMSRAVGQSAGAILRIEGEKHARATVLFPDGKTRQIWPMR